MPVTPPPTDSGPDRVLLASQSPRRRRLIALLGITPQVTAVDTPENLDTPLARDPRALAEALAAEKVLEARAQGLGPDSLVLTFDTIVVHEGGVLGKPMDVEDAWRMLRSLAGKMHQVVTGVAMLCPGADAPEVFSVATNVRMRDLSDRDIEGWMSSGEFMGCAGAYNIEGQVAEVDAAECFQNVAGAPLCHLYAHLRALSCASDLRVGVRSPIVACDNLLGRRCQLGRELLGEA